MIKLEKPKRDATCRICEKTLSRLGDDVINFTTTIGKDKKHFLCVDCVKELYKVSKGE